MDLQDKINRASEIEKNIKTLNKELKILNSEITNEQNNSKFGDFDPILRKYYSFELPNKHGNDWTDLTGWHGQNSRAMANKLEMLFDGFGPYDRHMDFDVMETVFNSEGVMETYLDYVDKATIKKLNLYEDGYLKNFDELDEDVISLIKDFIDMYTSIKVESCTHDW